MDQLLQEVVITKSTPRGTLRISAGFGFGRNIVAPMIFNMVARYPSLHVRLELFDRIVDVATEGFGLDARVGDEISPHLIARRLATNHRVLCAAPDYPAQRGSPRGVTDLANHDCLVIKERDHPFGVWRLRACGRDGGRQGSGYGGEEVVAKVTGPLSTNHGEIAVQWAVDGRGIVLRSLWDVGPLLAAGKLVQVLPALGQEANVWAVYPSRLTTSAKVRVCVEYLASCFESMALTSQRE